MHHINKLLLILIYYFARATCSLMGDECDWTGSGLSVESNRIVKPVYLRCREGRLTWLYPRGALRLIFRLPNNKQDFRLCLQTSTDTSDENELFIDDPEQRTMSNKFPARLYLEGSHHLLPFYTWNEDDIRTVKCFRSRRGYAALYMEADETNELQRAIAVVRYEARPLKNVELDDCRPCTEDDMALAYCTSDLVAEGEIVAINDREEIDSTQLTLKISKLIRYNEHSHNNWNNTIIQSIKQRVRVDDIKAGRLTAAVHLPLACSANAGPGQLLITARRSLGRLALVCAPRVEDWKEIVSRLTSAPCRID